MTNLIPPDIDPRIEFGILVSRFQIPTDDSSEQIIIWYAAIDGWPKMNRALESIGFPFDPNSSDISSRILGLGVAFETYLRRLGMFRPDGFPNYAVNAAQCYVQKVSPIRFHSTPFITLFSVKKFREGIIQGWEAEKIV